MLWDDLKLLHKGDTIVYRRSAAVGGGLETGRVVGFVEGAALIPFNRCLGVKVAIAARDIVMACRLMNGQLQHIYVDPVESAATPQRESVSRFYATAHYGENSLDPIGNESG